MGMGTPLLHLETCWLSSQGCRSILFHTELGTAHTSTTVQRPSFLCLITNSSISQHPVRTLRGPLANCCLMVLAGFNLSLYSTQRNQQINQPTKGDKNELEWKHSNSTALHKASGSKLSLGRSGIKQTWMETIFNVMLWERPVSRLEMHYGGPSLYVAMHVWGVSHLFCNDELEKAPAPCNPS